MLVTTGHHLIDKQNTLQGTPHLPLILKSDLCYSKRALNFIPHQRAN